VNCIRKLLEPTDTYKIHRVADGSISSPADSTPAWIRYAMPSVADLIFVALLGVLVFTSLSVRLLGDAGIGWHIRTGQQILHTHAIPRVDPFSSTMGAKKWYAWEWLYDLVVGQLDATLGLNGVVWLTAIAIAAVFAGAFYLLLRRGANLVVALVFTLLAVSASTIHFLARPHVLTWLFVLVWFSILDSLEQGCSRNRSQAWAGKLWLLPLLMLVWVNVHGGFLLGFALLGIYWLAALWDWARAKEDRLEDLARKLAARERSRRMFWAGLLSAAASFANPYGWKLHAHIYSYLSNRFLMDHIEEFQSPNFHGVAQKCFLLLLLITVAALALRGRELRVSHFLIVLFAVYTGLYSSRNIPVSSLLLAIIVAPLTSICALDFQFLKRMTELESALRGHAWCIVATVVTLFIALNGGRVGSSQLMDAHFDPRRMPIAAVDYLEKHEVNGPVFSPDSWGGYLIYRLYPHTKVVADDRHDLYGAEFFRLYLKAVHGEPGWQDFLAAHPARCVLLPKDAPLGTILAQSGWKLIYRDDTALIFVPS
jgi:hypothetical protein